MASVTVDAFLARVKHGWQVGDDGLTHHERERQADRYLATAGSRPTDEEIDAVKAFMKAQSG
jgi:hypothetical protein